MSGGSESVFSTDAFSDTSCSTVVCVVFTFSTGFSAVVVTATAPIFVVCTSDNGIADISAGNITTIKNENKC